MSGTGLQSITFAVGINILVSTHGEYVNILMTCSIIAFNLAFCNSHNITSFWGVVNRNSISPNFFLFITITYPLHVSALLGRLQVEYIYWLSCLGDPLCLLIC
jgi:hypothetical protein